MIRIIKNNITWMDVFQPKDEEVRELSEHFNLPSDLADELKKQVSRQKLDQYEDFIFAVTRFPIYNQHKKTSIPTEVDFLIKEDVIATVRYAAYEPIDEIFKQAESLEGFRAKHFGKTTAEFLDLLFENLFTYAQREMVHIDKKVNLITENVFHGREKEMIKQISQSKRDILDFRRILKPIQGVLRELSEEQKRIYREDKSNCFKHMVEAYADTIDLAQTQKDTLDSLETTNASILSSKLDGVTKIISWLAFFLAPFTVVGTLFQINTQFTPIVGSPGDWWIILGITLVCCALLYWFLKRKKLL